MKFIRKIKWKYKILYFACAIFASTYFNKNLHNRAYATKIYSEESDSTNSTNKTEKKDKQKKEYEHNKKSKPWQFKKGKNSEIFKEISEPSLKKIKEKFLTTKQLFKHLCDNGLSAKEAMNFYFNMSEEKISTLLGNDRYTINTDEDLTNKNNSTIYLNKERIKKDKKMSEKRKKELEDQNKKLKNEIKYFDEVYRLIQKYEVEYILKDKIKEILPKDPKKLEKVAFINPGHGFEDKGAIYNFNGKEIKECNINAKISKKIIEKLLHNDFQVYVVCNLKYSGIDLNKLPNKKNLHIIFEGRPPIIGNIEKFRVVDAYAVCMKTLIKEMQKITKKAKVNCLCLHHDYSSDSKFFGSVIFYEITKKTSKQLVENSKTFAEILFKNFKVPHKKLIKLVNKNGIKLNKSYDISKVKIEDWAMCHLGEENEIKLKEFVNHALVFVEEEYLSNPHILKAFLNDKIQEAFAKAIAMSFCEYFGVEYKDIKCKPQEINHENKKTSTAKTKNKKIKKIPIA